MPNEQYRPPPMESWQEEILADIERIKRIPEPILKKGPVYENRTKSGEVLRHETYEINLEEARKAGTKEILNPRVGNERLYLIAKDATGQVAGTRFTTLFVDEDKIEANSIIRVMRKGGGYAMPIEEAFQRQLQSIADRRGKPVVWKVKNQNLENLEEYRSGSDVEPSVLKEMEQEQHRWQILYGDGGKLGIVDGEKVFMPTAKFNSTNL